MIGVGQELATELGALAGHVAEIVQRLTRLLGTLRIDRAQRELEVPEHALEQVVEVVGHAAGQDPEGL